MPLKLMVGRWNVLLKWSRFRGHVKFRGVPFVLDIFIVPVPKDQHPHFGLVPAVHSKVEHFSWSRELKICGNVASPMYSRFRRYDNNGKRTFYIYLYYI